MTPQVLRYSAFTLDRAGGKPAGVVLDAQCLRDPQMLAIAQAIGYPETAFVLREDHGSRRLRLRCFTPFAETATTDHTTVAAAVAHAERHDVGRLDLVTTTRPIDVETRRTSAGLTATLTSPPAYSRLVAPTALRTAMRALHWSTRDLHGSFPPHVAFAGHHHLVLGVRARGVLDDFTYDRDLLRELMEAESWTTVYAFWPGAPRRFEARNASPVSGVVEDPATGAAAAALGAYLRTIGRLTAPTSFSVLQGHHIDAPSRLRVHLDPDTDTVRVSGTATELTLSPDEDLQCL